MAVTASGSSRLCVANPAAAATTIVIPHRRRPTSRNRTAASRNSSNVTCTSASDHTQSVVNTSAGASETAAANAAHVGIERPVSLAARRASSTHDSAPSPALRRRPLRYRPTASSVIHVAGASSTP